MLITLVVLPAQEPPVAQSSRDFHLDLMPGGVYPLFYRVDYRHALSSPGQVNSISQEMLIRYEARVLAIKGDHFLIHLAFVDVELSEETIGGLLAAEEPALIDLRKKFWQEQGSLFQTQLANLYLDLELARDGSLIRLDGKEDFISNMVRKMGTENSDSVTWLAGILADKSHELFADLFEYVPERAMAPGEAWVGFEGLADSTKMAVSYLYERRELGLDFISLRGNFTLEGESKMLGLKGAGWVQGFLVVDASTGWIKAAHKEARVSEEDVIVNSGISIPVALNFKLIRSH